MHTNALKKFFSVLVAAYQAVDKLTEKGGLLIQKKIVIFWNAFGSKVACCGE
jgi:hypothetical protein